MTTPFISPCAWIGERHSHRPRSRRKTNFTWSTSPSQARQHCMKQGKARTQKNDHAKPILRNVRCPSSLLWGKIYILEWVIISGIFILFRFGKVYFSKVSSRGRDQTDESRSSEGLCSIRPSRKAILHLFRETTNHNPL